MKIYTKLATGVALGAITGLAAFVMSHGHVEPVAAPVLEIAKPAIVDTSLAYWTQVAADNAATLAARKACRVQLHHTLSADGKCVAMVDCTSCTSKHGKPITAWVDFDNSPRRAGHVRVDYSFQMAEFTRHARDGEAAVASIEAGRKAYNHSVRCERLTWRADVQCKE